MKKQIFKYTIILVLFGLLTSSCNNKKKEHNTETSKKETVDQNKNIHQWTDADKKAFEKNCVGFLKASSVEKPDSYCDCLLTSVIKKYPIPQDAINLNQKELALFFEKSACIDDILLVKIISPWNDETEQLFLKECMAKANKNYDSEEKTKNYCDCALEEIKKIIPNPQHVLSLTEDELNSILDKCK